MPPLPDGHTIFVLATTALALYLFTRDRLPLEASSMAILVILILSFQFFPYESHGEVIGTEHFLLGFGHEALITICALMIMGKGLEVTGALQPVATFLAKAWMAWPRLASLVTLVASGVLSAFLNNTPIVVMLLPMLVGVAVRNKFAPSAILMPMGLATLVGGMATTIGTSTNLLVVAIAQDQGLERFSMFEFAIPAIIVGSFGMVFLWLVAPRLLPERKPPMSDTAPRVFNAVLHIQADSAANGLSFAECLALTDNEMRVERIERGEDLAVTRLPSVKILEGDRLVVRDTPERLKRFEAQLGAALHERARAGDVGEELQHLAQLVVTRDSKLYRASLLGIQFAQRTGLLPLALHRARDPELEEFGQRYRLGFITLGGRAAGAGHSGPIVAIEAFRNGAGTGRHHRSATAPTVLRRAMLIMALVILAAATGVLPIEAAAVAGVGLHAGEPLSSLGRRLRRAVAHGYHDHRCQPGAGGGDDRDGRSAVSRPGARATGGRTPDSPDSQQPDAGDGDTHEHHFQQRHGSHRCAGGDPDRQRTGSGPGTVCTGGHFRRQHELRDALRLQDQHSAHVRRRL